MKMKELISWNDFSKIDIRIGTILSAKIFENARKPAYIIEIDFGPLGIKKSSAQVTKLYSPNELVGKQIVAIVNFPPKQIANIMSECLILGGLESESEVILLSSDKKATNGIHIG